MAALALPDSALSGGRPVNDVNTASSLEVKWHADRTRFRVKAGQVYYGWFANSASNRQVVLVLLRHLYDSRTGRRLVTEHQLAALLGRPNRQAGAGHRKGVREAEEERGKFLRRPRKVDPEVVELVWNPWSADPSMSLSEVTARVNAVYEGEKFLSSTNVRDA